MSKWYGSLSNRLEENKMFCDKIEVGTGMTEYFYSDCHAYEVVKVINQKHIFVRELGHRAKPNAEPFSNDWDLFSDETKPIEEMKLRYGYWNFVNHYDSESIKRAGYIPNEIYKKVREKGEAVGYRRANVSFGKAEYYYDYEF